MLFLRLLVAIVLGPDRFLASSLFNQLLGAAILCGAMSAGMAVANQFWRSVDQPTTTRQRFSTIRNRSTLALYFGTVSFAVLYSLLTLINAPHLEVMAANLAIGAIAGAGLGLATYGMPTSGPRLRARSWAIRIFIAGATYAALQAPSGFGKITIVLNFAWGRDGFARAYAQSNWLQNQLFTSRCLRTWRSPMPSWSAVRSLSERWWD
jgi:hypothetical protein